MTKSSDNSNWQIDLRPKAIQQLEKLPKQIRDRILSLLKTRIRENPRRIGDALQGRLKGFWRYRVGDYRVICLLKDEIVTVVVVEIGHRRDIYEN